MGEPKEGPWTYVEGVRRRAWLCLSHRERLEWLWQAKLFAQRAMGAANPLFPSAKSGGKKS